MNMKRFIAVSGLTIMLIFSGCSSAKETNLGVSTIDTNGWLSTVAIETVPAPKVAPTPIVVPAPAVIKVDVISLPQADGKVGKVVVSDDDKTTMLDQAWQKVETKHLDKKEILSKEIVESKYRDLLEAMPEEPNNYRMYFKYDSTDIVGDSKILMQIVEDITSNPTLKVDVIGYTDRAGDDAYNKILSMKRAQKVVKLLESKGIDNKLIALDYYGEENPIVPTEDGVANEQNRRVEVTIK